MSGLGQKAKYSLSRANVFRFGPMKSRPEAASQFEPLDPDLALSVLADDGFSATTVEAILSVSLRSVGVYREICLAGRSKVSLVLA
jgi:hypothetical protein